MNNENNNKLKCHTSLKIESVHWHCNHKNVHPDIDWKVVVVVKINVVENESIELVCCSDRFLKTVFSSYRNYLFILLFCATLSLSYVRQLGIEKR